MSGITKDNGEIIMTAEIIKINKRPSKWGGSFFYVFFKGLDGKSYYSCIYPKMRNYARWKKVLDTGVTLSGLRLVKGRKNLIDADSRFQIVEE